MVGPFCPNGCPTVPILLSPLWRAVSIFTVSFIATEAPSRTRGVYAAGTPAGTSSVLWNDI